MNEIEVLYEKRKIFSTIEIEERKDYSSSVKCIFAVNNDISDLELFSTLPHIVICEQYLLQVKSIFAFSLPWSHSFKSHIFPCWLFFNFSFQFIEISWVEPL